MGRRRRWERRLHQLQSLQTWRAAKHDHDRLSWNALQTLSGIFYYYYFVGMERRGGQKDAEIFHHRFLCLIQHSFVLFFTKGQVLRKVPLPAYSSERELLALSLCSHLYLGRFGRKWCVKVCVDRNTLSCAFFTCFVQQEGQIWNTAMNMCGPLAPDSPNLCLKQNWTTQCHGDSFGFPGLGGMEKW